MKRDGANQSIWQYGFDNSEIIANQHKQHYDVLIVGGGLTGLTTAILLQEQGFHCMVAEAHSPGFGTTLGATAHLNTLLDTYYSEIEKKFSPEVSKTVYQAAEGAIDQVQALSEQYQIDCDFSRKDALLYAQNETQNKTLVDAVAAFRKAGGTVEAADNLPGKIPFDTAARFSGQGQVHPTKLLLGLAKVFQENGSVLETQCRVTGVKEAFEGLLHVETTRGPFSCNHLIYATHIPPGVNLLHFRCAPYRSYVLGLTLENEQYPDELVYDMYEYYHYWRTHEIHGRKYLILGGEDHKTGEETNPARRFTNLENFAKKHFSVGEVSFKWSSQYFENADGLPYIGRLPGSPDNVWVATGFGGNGITYGQVAARVLTELISKKEEADHNIFDPGRIKPIAGFKNFVSGAADVISQFVSKPFTGEKMDDLASLAAGEGKIVLHEGKKIGICKDESGNAYCIRSACTHIQCDVVWNSTELTWECPCHGSRFAMNGEMITAPARKDLQKMDLMKVREKQ